MDIEIFLFKRITVFQVIPNKPTLPKSKYCAYPLFLSCVYESVRKLKVIFLNSYVCKKDFIKDFNVVIPKNSLNCKWSTLIKRKNLWGRKYLLISKFSVNLLLVQTVNSDRIAKESKMAKRKDLIMLAQNFFRYNFLISPNMASISQHPQKS